jgi:uncharacterized protein (TIGR02118 family)
MVKLVIMIEPLENWDAFEASWPRFLHLVESMPGLRREATSRVDSILYGSLQVGMVHELFFDSLETAKQAMASVEGRAAGTLLQGMTRGQVTLFLADHKEDDLANISKYRSQKGTQAV